MRTKNSDIVRNWVEKGISEKDPKKKLHYFDMALELDPNDPAALNNKGMVLHKEGKPRDAIDYYDRILKQYNMTRSLPALYNKSLALKEIGMNEAALTFMNRALKQQPDNEKIKKHVEDLTLIVEGKADKRTSKPANVPSKDLAVNQIYDRWEPPAVTTLLAHAMKCSQKDIKYYKGFGEDLVKEKIIQENLSNKLYSCSSCKFCTDDRCHYKDTKGMMVAPKAICRNFRPRNKDNK
ncbi:tetratricopeptide repeat protein [Methanolobus profundi]|uniref:TPR repeat-containing protein n=1 Tax=Methanolobus profundi TaxID=487685 RepID=A0A1I4NX29_9EURY|nr:tetratricopeptide repeat protein [Methanolobus profundi]SFM20104.1 TPR repeat-containing protein [Methanolobus profundi]